MITTLIPSLQKPALWQRSPQSLWDDEHISRGMLEAHLDPDIDAASRTHDFIRKSVEWLNATVPAQSTILDLGCGPGLYAKQLAEAGYQVTGIDISKRSIDYAKAQDQKSIYLCGDYLELDCVDIYDAITLIYCDYGALTSSERATLQLSIFRALKPGGQLILDVFTDKYHKDKCDGTSWKIFDQGGYWSQEPHLCLRATHLYNEGVTILEQYVIVTDQASKEYLIWNTVFSKEALEEELSPLKLTAIYDTVCGDAYTGQRETMCLVFVKD
jgi:SAM-dependent methyltransferase